MATSFSPLGPSDWGVMHDLALLYLALIHGTDLDIAPSEQETLERKLHAWFPQAEESRTQQVFNEVMLTYMGGHSREMLDASIASIKESMDKGRRIAVLNDLAELATADGTLVPGEISFIQQLAEFWEVSSDVRN